MKMKHTIHQVLQLSVVMLFGLSFTTCSKDEKKDNNINDPITLSADYSGEFFVDFANQFPPWSERSGIMQVTVSKTGVVAITPDSLIYSGDTIIANQSMIERLGKIEITPVASVKHVNGEIHVLIDPVMLVMDHQIYYVWDNVSNWVVYNEIYDTVLLHDELPFSLSEATANEATLESTDIMGSFKYTLRLND